MPDTDQIVWDSGPATATAPKPSQPAIKWDDEAAPAASTAQIKWDDQPAAPAPMADKLRAFGQEGKFTSSTDQPAPAGEPIDYIPPMPAPAPPMVPPPVAPKDKTAVPLFTLTGDVGSGASTNQVNPNAVSSQPWPVVPGASPTVASPPPLAAPLPVEGISDRANARIAQLEQDGTRLTPQQKSEIVRDERSKSGLQNLRTPTPEEMAQREAAKNTVLENVSGGVGRSLGTTIPRLISTVAPGFGGEQIKAVEAGYPTDPNSIAAKVGYGAGELGKMLVTPPAAFAGVAGAEGVGSARAEIAARRAAGQKITPAQEAIYAAGSGIKDAAVAQAALGMGEATAPISTVAGRVAANVGGAVGAGLAGQTAQNILAQGTIDPNRSPFAGDTEAAITAGFFGLGGSAFSEALNGKLGEAWRGMRAGKAIVPASESPAYGSDEAGARAELGLPASGKLDEVQIAQAYRRRGFQTHPDAGGTDEAFQRTVEAAKLLRDINAPKPPPKPPSQPPASEEPAPEAQQPTAPQQPAAEPPKTPEQTPEPVRAADVQPEPTAATPEQSPAERLVSEATGLPRDQFGSMGIRVSSRPDTTLVDDKPVANGRTLHQVTGYQDQIDKITESARKAGYEMRGGSSTRDGRASVAFIEPAAEQQETTPTAQGEVKWDAESPPPAVSEQPSPVKAEEPAQPPTGEIKWDQPTTPAKRTPQQIQRELRDVRESVPPTPEGKAERLAKIKALGDELTAAMGPLVVKDIRTGAETTIPDKQPPKTHRPIKQIEADLKKAHQTLDFKYDTGQPEAIRKADEAVKALSQELREAQAAAATPVTPTAPEAPPKWFADLTRAGREDLARKAKLGNPEQVSKTAWHHLPDGVRTQLEKASTSAESSAPAGKSGIIKPEQSNEPVRSDDQPAVSRPTRDTDLPEPSTGETTPDVQRPVPAGERPDRPIRQPGSSGTGNAPIEPAGGGSADLAEAGEEPAGPVKAGAATGGRGSGSVSGDAGPGSADVLKPPAEPLTEADRNHVIKPNDVVAPRGNKTKFDANITAIETLRALESENRNPTPAEKQVLARYTGWGWAGEHFNKNNARYAEQYAKLRQVMTDDEFRSARESVINAHYTATPVIRSMWDMLKQMGFDGGKVLEPGAGVGHFFGMMPPEIADKSDLTGVELDNLSARIATKLYPQADIRNSGYQNTRIANNSQDVAVSNVPFDNGIVGAPDHPKANLHDYYFLRSIDKVKPGGLVAFITSDGTLDKGDSSVRAEIAQAADLVAAFRLPNNAFKDNAGTDVTTDIIILRKKDGSGFKGKPFQNLTTVGQGTYTDKEGAHEKDICVNEYYAAHPENALGEHALAGTMYTKGDYALVAKPGQDTAALLEQAVTRLPADIFGKQPPALPELNETGTEAPGMKEHAVVRKGDQIYEVRDGKLVEPEWLTRRGFGDKADQPIDPTTAAIRMETARDWTDLRDAVNKLFAAENDPKSSDALLKQLRREMGKQYDAFEKTWGTVNKKYRHLERAAFLEDEPDYPLVQSIEDSVEITDPKTGKVRYEYPKGKIFTSRIREPDVMPEHASNIDDAMSVSLGFHAKIDADVVAKLMGITSEEATNKIVQSGRGFVHPNTGKIETREQYLSGNVRKKLREATLAAKDDPRYKDNVEALKAVQPEDRTIDGIRFQLSARWIPHEVLEKFIGDVLQGGGARVHYVQEANTYTVSLRDRNSPQIQTTFGTPDMDAIELLSDALNGNEPTIKRKDADGKPYVDMEATTTARTMLGNLKREFESWVKTSQASVTHDGTEKIVQRAMEDEFNTVNNAVVAPQYDGSYLKLPGLTKAVRRTPHMLSIVARVLQEGSAVMAHGVGSGKTYAQIVMTMERKRLGLSKKPMVVVQKATVGQFAASFRRAYPDGRVLVANEKSFTKRYRAKFFARIATGDWDAVVLTQPQFDRLQNKPQAVLDYFNKQLDALADAISASDDDATTKQLVKAEKALRKRLDKIIDGLKKRQDNNLFFEDLGVDSLSIDEAHAYKKIPIITRKQNVKGIPSGNSQRATGLEMKLQHIQGRGNGRGVVLATGTPITNSMAEAYVMLKMAAPHVLDEYHIRNFDDFANTFGQLNSQTEFTWSGKWKYITRFNKFVNRRELVTMIRSAFDVKIGNKELGLQVPAMRGGKPELIIAKQNSATAKINDYIMAVADRFEGLEGQERRLYSWVPIVTMQAGMAGALDPRLIDPALPDLPDSKVNTAIRKIAAIHKATAGKRGTQLVFADRFKPLNLDKLEAFVGGRPAELGMPDDLEDPDAQQADDQLSEDDADDDADSDTGGEVDKEAEARAAAEQAEYESAGFNLYHDIRDKLIKLGVPAKEIAIIHDYNTDKKREKLFDQMNAGTTRVLLGSTEKTGVGVNVQRLLVAMHHLDPPRMMTPAMLEQRDGRGVRQGNLWASTHLPDGSVNSEFDPKFLLDNLRYGTEKSMDIGIYQMLESKNTMIQSVLKGEGGDDDIDDLADEATLSMAEMKAQLTGDTRSIKKIELDAKVRQLEAEQSAFDSSRSRQVRTLDETRRLAKNYRDKYVPQAEAMAKLTKEEFIDKPKDEWTVHLDATNKTTEGGKDIAKAIEGEFDRLKELIGQATTLTKTAGLTLNGIRFEIDGRNIGVQRGDQRFHEFDGSWRMLDSHGTGVRWGNATTGRGFLSSVETGAENMQSAPAEARQKQKDAERQIPELENAVSKTWDKSDQLAKLRDERDALNAELVAAGQTATKAAPIFNRKRQGGFVNLGAIADAIDPVVQKMTGLPNTLRSTMDDLSGRSAPRITRASRSAGEAAVNYASSGIAGPLIARSLAAQVLGPHFGDQEFTHKLGAVLTEDNLHSVRGDLLNKANEAENRDEIAADINEQIATLDSEEDRQKIRALTRERNRVQALTDEDVEKFKEQAENVYSVIGADDSPFASDADYIAALKDPEIQQAIERHREVVMPYAEELYKSASQIDPDAELPPRGEVTGARINLKALSKEEIEGGDTKPVRPISGKSGNITNPYRRKSPFARQATGAGEAYDINYENIVNNSVTRQLESATRNDWYDAMVKAGLAKISKKPGAPVVIGGKPARGIPIVRRVNVILAGGKSVSIPQNETLFVRHDLYDEARRVMAVDQPLRIPIITAFANVANKAALAGLTEATIHGTNLLTVLQNTPGLMESNAGRAITALGGLPKLAGAISASVRKFSELASDSPQVRDTLADLALIGALRGPSDRENFIGHRLRKLDTVVRLVMNDAFNHLVKLGAVEDTDTNRREFINRVGQYNARLQGPLVAALRSTGIGPFATAGFNFTREAYRRATGSAGAKATSKAQAVKLRAAQFASALGGLLLTPAILNWLFTHKKKGGGFMGRPGTPIGAVDLGYDSKDGKPMIFDLARLFGLRRSLRATGLGAFISSKQQGMTNARAFDEASQDIANSIIGPMAGPVIRAIALAATGSEAYVGGWREANKAEPGESQTKENLKSAAIGFNPLVKSVFKGLGDKGEPADILRGQIPGLTPTPGKRPDRASGSQAIEMIREMMEGNERVELTPQQQERAKLRRQYAERMRDKDPKARADMMRNKALTIADRKRVREMAKDSQLLYMVKHDGITALQAMKVFDVATLAERKQIAVAIRQKVHRSQTMDSKTKAESIRHINRMLAAGK